MGKKLFYKVIEKGIFKTIEIRSENEFLFEIECFTNSPYTNEEEIQNFLDDNGYGDEVFEFIKL